MIEWQTQIGEYCHKPNKSPYLSPVVFAASVLVRNRILSSDLKDRKVSDRYLKAMN